MLIDLVEGCAIEAFNKRKALSSEMDSWHPYVSFGQFSIEDLSEDRPVTKSSCKLSILECVSEETLK